MRVSGWLTAILVGLLAFNPLLGIAADPPITEVEGKNLGQWVKDLGSGDASHREEAIRAVVLFPGPHSGDVITSLLARCQDRDSSVRVRATMALTILEVRKEEILRIVKAMGERLTTDGQVIVRFHAAVCLLRFGEDSKDALSALLKGAEDPSSFEIRRLCLRVLESCGHLNVPTPQGQYPPPDPRVTTVILRSLADPTSQVRLEAVIALGSMGLSNDPSLQDRTRRALASDMMRDPDRTVVIWSLVSTMALDKPTEDGVKKIKAFLHSTDQRVRIQAIKALGVIGNRVKTVVPSLVELLDDKDPIIVVQACTALAALGAKGGALVAVPALTNLAARPGLDKAVKVFVDATIVQLKGK